MYIVISTFQIYFSRAVCQLNWCLDALTACHTLNTNYDTSFVMIYNVFTKREVGIYLLHICASCEGKNTLNRLRQISNLPFQGL